VPHGILELPAFLIAAALGLRIGWEWLYKESDDNRWNIFKMNLKQAMILAPGIALLLFMAALIEVFVSGQIIS
jgi:stage II sporulation protein M